MAYTKSLGLRGLAGKFPSFRMPLTETSLLSARTARLRTCNDLSSVSLQQTNKYIQSPWPSDQKGCSLPAEESDLRSSAG